MYWKNGNKIKPILPRKKRKYFDELTTKFFDLKKSRYIKYWRKRLFSGAGTPPSYIKSNEEFLKLIETNEAAIGIMKEKPRSNESIKVYEF